MRKQFDIKKFSHQLVMTGMAEMVEKDGLTPHEVFEVLDDAKSQLWSALCQIQDEVKVK